MNIKPVASPGAIPQNGTPEHVRTAKAMAAFNRGASSYDQAPVGNQNQVQPEEMSALKPKQNQQVNQRQQEQPTSVEASDDVQMPEIPAPEPTPVVEETAASRQFAQLARQAKALRQRQQEQEQSIKAKEAQLAEREAAIKAQEGKYSQGYIQQDSLKNDPLRALLDAGVSYEDLTERLLAQSNPMDPRVEATFSKLEARIQSLTQQNEELVKNNKSAEETQYQAAVKQIKADVKQLVYTDPSFEGIKATNSVDDVVELIERTYKEDGILLSAEEAAQEIEDYIIEEADKLSRLSKLEKRRQSASKPTEQSQAPKAAQTQVSKQPQPMRTLTNANASTRTLSARERALLAFKGELKK